MKREAVEGHRAGAGGLRGDGWELYLSLTGCRGAGPELAVGGDGLVSW